MIPFQNDGESSADDAPPRDAPATHTPRHSAAVQRIADIAAQICQESFHARMRNIRAHASPPPGDGTSWDDIARALRPQLQPPLESALLYADCHPAEGPPAFGTPYRAPPDDALSADHHRILYPPELKAKIPKANNAFLYWATPMRKCLIQRDPSLDNSTLSVILGRAWQSIPLDEKACFEHLFTLESNAIRAHQIQSPSRATRRRGPKKKDLDNPDALQPLILLISTAFTQNMSDALNLPRSRPSPAP